MIYIENLITEDLPREVLHGIFKSIDEMPIRGAWGYTKDDAVIIDMNDPIVPQDIPFNGVGLEYIFVRAKVLILG